MYRYLALAFTLALPAVALAQTTPSTAPPTSPRSVAEEPRIKNFAETVASLEAAYPPDLRNAGVGGTVQVRMLVDKMGVPSEFAVETGSGNPQIDSAALVVAAVLRFYPATLDEKPVPLRTTVPIPFAPEPDSTPAPDTSACAAMLSRMGAASPGEMSRLPAGVYGSYAADPPGLINVAEVRRAMEHDYPRGVGTPGVIATVHTRFIVDTAGVPTSVAVMRGSGECALDAAAVRTVRRMRFRPAQLKGSPVPSSVDMPISFMPD